MLEIISSTINFIEEVTMSSIALFPCSFTPVDRILASLSHPLRLEIYNDENLIADVAAKFGSHPKKIKKMMFKKTSVFNQFTLEKELTINQLRSVLADKLDQPHQFLLHGFLTSLIPSNISHVLKVLAVNTKKGRIDFAMQQGLTRHDAQKQIRLSDISAYGWTDFLFRKEAYDKSLYDLVLPIGKISHDRMIGEIIDTYHKTALLHTEKSQQAIADMKLAIKVERLLLENGHKISVQAKDNNINLMVNEAVLNFNKLSKELSNLAHQIEEVDQVEVKKNPEYAESIYRKQQFELPSKVLFVDDEREFTRTVSARLISRDVGTYGVYSGAEALEVLEEDRPDVMVLDLKMPGMHGVEVLRRTKEKAPEVEVIILTGHGTNKDMQDCMALGAFAYLNKPVDIEKLSETIKAANQQIQAKAA